MASGFSGSATKVTPSSGAGFSGATTTTNAPAGFGFSGSATAVSSGNQPFTGYGGFQAAPSQPQAPSLGGGLGAPPSDPRRMLEEQVAQAGMPPEPPTETREQRRKKINDLRNRYIKYAAELRDFFEELELDEALDSESIRKEVIYAVGMLEQEKQGQKQAEKQAKDEERRFEKFRKEQIAQEQKAVATAQKQESDFVKLDTKAAVDLQREQIRAGSKAPAAPAKEPPKSAFSPWEQERMAQEFIEQDRQKQFQETIERQVSGITDPVQADMVAEATVKIEALREAIPNMPAGQQMQAKALLAKMIGRRANNQQILTTQEELFWQEATGAAKAAGRAIRETVVPTTVGAGAGIAATRAIAAKVNPLVGIVLGVGAGIAGALGAAKAQAGVQKAVLGEEDFARYQQKLTEDRQKYPTAVFAGEQLPSLLVGKVNAKELKSAVTAAKSILQGRSVKGLSNEQVVALYNAAFGGSLGAGQEVARGLKEGDVKWGEVAAAAILNSVINDTRFGAPVKAKADTLSVTPDAKIDLDKEAANALDAFAKSIKDTEAATPVAPPARPVVEPTPAPTPREATRQVEEEIARTATEQAPVAETKRMEDWARGDTVRREINSEIKAGNVVVSKKSPAWGPIEFKSKNGRVEVRITDGPEGFGKERSGQAKHDVLVDGKIVYEGEWHYGRSPDQDTIDAFSNAIKTKTPTPEVTSVRVGETTFNFRDGEWYREGSTIPVKSATMLRVINEEASRAVQVRKTETIPVGERAGGRPEVDEGVRVETPAVKAEDQVKAQAEVAPPAVMSGTQKEFLAQQAKWREQAKRGEITDAEFGRRLKNFVVTDGKRQPPKEATTELPEKLPSQQVGKALKRLQTELDDPEYGINGFLGDWAGAELTPSGRIVWRERRGTGESLQQNKGDFVKWLMSDDAKNMSADANYQSELAKARQIVSEEFNIVSPKSTVQLTKPPEPVAGVGEAGKPVEGAAMDIRAEAARKAQEGSVDVSGFAKLKQSFARTWENLKAQNATDRDLLAAREGEAAADRLARQTEANLNATRTMLRKQGIDDAQVARDMNLAIRAEGSLTVDGRTYSKENIQDLGYMEARNIAKAAGIELPKGATKKDVVKLLLDRTTPDMTPEQFATKYNLTGEDKDRWLQNFKDAEDLASKLGVRLDEAGLSGLGQYVSENVGYATRRYLRNIKEGFVPKPEARTKAEDIVAESVAKRVQNLGTRASKLGDVDLNRYLNAANDTEASAFIRNLAPAQREEANDIRKAYQGLRSAVTVITKDVESGAIKIDVDPQQVRNIAASIVDDMLQPPRNLADSANAGAGNAINSLLRRDLKPVFRELFGEIDDPAVVAAASRENQARNVARFAALADVAKKSGFIETDAMKAKEKGWVRLASDQKVGGTVSDYDRRRFGVLAGSYAPESVKAMLTNQDYHAIKLPEVVRSVEGAVNKLAGIQRGSTVNLRPKSWIRDIITNVTTFAGGSGDLADPITFGKHYKDAMKVIGKHAKAKASGDSKARGETERFFRMLADKGIFRAQTSSYWDDVSDAITGSGKLATAWKTIGEGKSMFADMPVKYAAYMTRMEKAKSWGWSDDKAREWAMEGLTRHYDNRDAVPKSFRDVARKGLVPDYLTFKYSSIRARALQTKDIFKDLQRDDIPLEYRGRMLTSYLSSLAAQPIIAGTRVGGKVAKYGAVLGTLYKGSEVLSTDAEQVDDKDLDNANRYFSPRYAQQDGKVYFTDTKNGKKRLTTFSLTGAVTASPFEDAIVGSLQAGVNPDLDNDLVSKLFEATVGSDVPMLWNAFSEFVAGEPLLAKYDNPGFFNAIATRRDALRKATLLRKRGQEDAAMEQEKIGKEYGMEALMRVAGTADIFLGPLVGAAERGRTLEAEQVRRERRMTEATEAGPRKPKGYGPEEGRPTEEYRPTLDTMDIASGQVFPFNVRIETIEDARSRVYGRAANLRAGMRETSKETEEAQFETGREEKREARKTILDAYMEPWVRNARAYLSWYGEEDVEARLKDALSKSNFSDWEIEYILQSPPAKSTSGPGFSPPSPPKPPSPPRP